MSSGSDRDERDLFEDGLDGRLGDLFDGGLDGRFDDRFGDRFDDGLDGTPEDEQVRALLAAGLPDFPTTVALGDRALAVAARRRARARAFGGVGAVALVAGCALAVVPLVGWAGGGGGRGGQGAAAGVANDVVVAGASVTPSPSPTPTGLPTGLPPSVSGSGTPLHIVVSSVPQAPAWVNSPKQQAMERVAAKLQSGGHNYSYMGVGLTPDDLAAATDASPIIVYRKPVASDPTLEQDAKNAAYPFNVVFHDTTLDASEQWYLGHRLEQDMGYWKGQGVEFQTSLQNDGTITIFATDPGTVVSLLEAHYGYNGSVFVGQVFSTAAPSS